MPITNGVITATPVPSLIATGDASGVVVSVNGVSGVVLGGPNVTPTTGLGVAAGVPLTLDLRQGDALYAVHAVTGAVMWLATRQ